MFANCDKINTIAGLPCEMEVRNKAIIFHTFLHQLSKLSSAKLMEKSVTAASGQELKVFNRYEMDVEIGHFVLFYPELCGFDQNEDDEVTTPVIDQQPEHHSLN